MLGLSRWAIDDHFITGNILKIGEDELPSDKFKEQQPCFVTLTIAGKLRGCIGHLEAIQPLYLDIIENSVAAAFNDYRFTPLTKEEFNNIDIEISILSKPQTLEFSSPDDLLNKLTPGTDGVILRRQKNSATYLPQVWEEISDKKEFLSSLCAKAGLEEHDWEKPGLEVMTYTVEAFS